MEAAADAAGRAVPRVLDTTEGAEMIDAARGLDPLYAREKLAKSFPAAGPDDLRAAIAQAELQERAGLRFPRARQLLWTRDGLEQASRPAASAHRASELVAAGITSAVDLTCGLGLDMLAMAALGLSTVGVERDPVIADLARRNTARLDLADRVTVITGSCQDPEVLAQLPTEGAWFADPARRSGARGAAGEHRRLLDAEQWSPPWSWLVALAERIADGHGPRVLVAKTSPAIAHGDLETAAAQWLSIDGDVVEATAWWGLGHPGSRCAVLLDAAEQRPALRVWAHGSQVEVTGLPAAGSWLIEPDAAVIRAGAVADLARAIEATLVDDHLAYLSAAEPLAADDPRGQCWQVLYAGGYDPGALRALCDAEAITRVDLTGRGRQLDPRRVARDLNRPGGPGRTAKLFTLGLGTTRQTAVILASPRE